MHAGPKLCGRQSTPKPLHPNANLNMQAETDYCYNVLEDTEQLQEQLYLEMRGRIQEADQSAPVRSAEHSVGMGMLMGVLRFLLGQASPSSALADMVRSTTTAALWKASSTAYTAEGSFHPKLLLHQVCSHRNSNRQLPHVLSA